MNNQFMNEYSTIFKVIEKTPLFSALSKEEIREMLSLMTLKNYKKGEIIFEQDSSPNNIYIIENGIVKLFHKKDDIDFDIGTFTTGNCFGEVALIGILPYIGTAIAMCELSVLQFSKISLHKLSKTNIILFNKFLFNISREVCRRLYTIDKQLVNALEENSKLNNSIL
ncbi:MULTISPECIES: Crp/Fnr family transcriptional regulator [Fusobacterium]|uniref:Crp/Fnr family transcriptional regulator n=1 Tax=Fusobacterium TaxID=848 RepID=UPI001032FEA8|nr:cyclic nucleotide-binding domain-containing protein [Fusobacterium ulcerans]